MKRRHLKFDMEDPNLDLALLLAESRERLERRFERFSVEMKECFSKSLKLMNDRLAELYDPDRPYRSLAEYLAEKRANELEAR